MATAIRIPFREQRELSSGTEDLPKVAEAAKVYQVLGEDEEEAFQELGSAETRSASDPDVEDLQDQEDPQDEMARVIREHDLNQLFVAFTATPSPATVKLFGKPFDIYSEAEAIEEGYIEDVAQSIISYKTLYNLHCPIVPLPKEEKLYPPGVVSKALKNVAYQDSELIQYKSEVMLRIFEDKVKPLIGGRAKAMIVATSRIGGLLYYKIIKEKLRERNADYKILYAFSDFVHPETNQHISEHTLNDLKDGEVIEDRFEEET
jgi:type I restriction enzyme R subunit